MESINNMAQAAARAVWGTGQSTEEPVSGKTGNTSKGEPYDAGNMGEPRSTVGGESNLTADDNNDTTGADNYTTSSDKFRNTTGTDYLPTRDNEYHKPADEFTTRGTDDKTTSDSNFKSSETTDSKPTTDETRDTTGSTPFTNRDQEYKSTGDNTTTTSTNENATSSSAGPHKEFGSSVKPNEDMSKAQQDVRDPSDPQTRPKDSQVRENVDDTTGGPDKDDNPAKIDGPGPRPVEEVAKEYGGDAGNAKPAEKRESAEEDDGDGPQKTSHGSGTGEQYVKSSGLQADGGDFDATKPGAGREADRLLEEKGIHHEGNNKASTDDDAHDAAGAHEGKEKKSLGEKIKAKLHKPHMKH